MHVDEAFIEQAFAVPGPVHLLSGFVDTFPRFFRWLGNLETKLLADELATISIEKPIFVAGLARSGTTILLEALAKHPSSVTHRYGDFPFLHIPYWWNKTRRDGNGAAPIERAHGDRLMVTNESPEAMEEVIWQSFFGEIHDPDRSQVLDEGFEAPDFERFYRDHIRKLLFVRKGERYVSKGNYNFSRLGFLQKMFPDARFIVPIRRPEQHIGSLIKQHRIFCVGEHRFPRALKQMQRIGHYEFGLDRRPLNVGNNEIVREIQELWARGEEVRGWARYWAHLYGWMADQLDKKSELTDAILPVRYEELCADPLNQIKSITAHCHLEENSSVTSFAGQIHAPTYYRTSFAEEELRIIQEETAATAARFGYELAACEVA